MGRPLRAAAGGYVYHVLNRANARRTIFRKPDDYAAFERILAAGVERFRPRLLAYCLMPNHWHLVLHPQADGLLSRFVGWLTLTHTQRLHAARGSTGEGHIYQGRFKSFAMQEDDHFYAVVRYVERNALRAGLVERADQWPWCSLARRWEPSAAERPPRPPVAADAERPQLAPWPCPRPNNWRQLVERVQTEAELAAIRRSVARGNPLGDDRWTGRTVAKLGLESTLRPRGRPRKTAGGE